MMKSNFSTFFLAIILLIVLGACSSNIVSDNNKKENKGDDKQKEQEVETEASGGELQIAFAQQPPVIDTHVTQAQAAADMAKQIFETLVTVDSKGTIQPMLADSWEQSEDGKTYTFHLKQGTFFHNGKEMLAEDVAASMNRWIEITGAGKEQFQGAKFETDGEYTAVLSLAQPTATTLAILAYTGGNFPAIMPKELIESAEPTGVKEYIGTGPFKFVEWKQDQYIHFTKFEDYEPRTEPADGLAGKKEAFVDDIYFNFVSDASTRIAGLISGQYDLAHAIPIDDVENLAKETGIENHAYPGGYLGIFFNKKQGIFANQTAREAVAIGLNLEEILQGAYIKEEFYSLNHNISLTHQLGQWSSDAGKDKYNVHDLDKAKELLSKTDYNGEEITIVTTREIEQPYNASIVLQQTLQAMGMNAKVQVYDRAAFEQVRADENGFDIFVQTATTKPEPSSNVYMRRDFGGFTDSDELDEIIADFRGKPSLEEAQEVYSELQKWLWDYLPIVKVGDFNEVTSSRNTVENFRHQDGFILWNVSNNK